jgi:tetratricopeptide (TPR) repeat protein
VAVGLAWVTKRTEIAEEKSTKLSTPKSGTVTTKDIRKWLEALDPKVILDMLMSQVATDECLRQELVLKIAKENARGIDLAVYRTTILNGCSVGGYLDYGDVYDYSEKVGEVVDSIERLLKEGFADETITLCEFALERLGGVMEKVDDSDGYVGAEVERLLELHLKACRKKNPEPTALAERLLRYETAWGGFDIFYDAANTYRDILGKQGLATYRRLVEKEWQAIPAKSPGNRQSGWDSRREGITRIMESLAKAEGDVDGLIAIKKLDLSGPWNYLSIAEILRKAGRHDEALRWAEDGLMAFKDRPDDRLRDFIAEEYHRLKRFDDAYRLNWIQFAERPELSRYQKLLEYSRKIKKFHPAREEALAWLRKEIEKEKSNPHTRYWQHKPDHTRLVEIFLWEKDGEAAWKEARAGGCRDSLWLELARQREKERPAEVVPVYQRLVEPIIAQMKNDAYEEATQMIRHIRELMHGLGQKAEFAAYLAQVRLRHKPKRNLMKLLDLL